MIRWLLTPRAIARHLLVIMVVSTLVMLGQWQLSRLDEVRAINASARARMSTSPIEFASLMREVGIDAEPTDRQWHTELDDATLEMIEHRRVVVTGRYLHDQEVLQRNREHRGRSGFHILTPLVIDGFADHSVLVRRGWIPPEFSQPPVEVAAPPQGPITVVGVIERSVDQPGFGPQDPQEGVLERVFHPDTRRLDRQVDGALLPLVVRIDHATSPGDDSVDPLALPVALDPLNFDEANHQSYAVQWHLFAALAAVTYVAWLASQARQRAKPPAAHSDRPS